MLLPSAAPPAPPAPRGRHARVAVVGAGAGGLAAIRALRLEGHSVVCFEAASGVGGTWDGGADRPLYDSLRTNLPRSLMAFDAFPWSDDFGGDSRIFCSSLAVQRYLEAYADAFSLRGAVRCRCRVTRATPLPRGAGWEVTALHTLPDDAADRGSQTLIVEVFDALIVASGHYAQPFVPPLVASCAPPFPGCVSHSSAYRSPAAFAGLRVLVVGAASSGEDISREISTVTARVVLAAETFQAGGEEEEDSGGGGGGTRSGRVERRRAKLVSLRPDGSVLFADGSTLDRVDHVLFCTGYETTFPFFDENLVDLRVSDNSVSPLFEHMWPVSHAPSLSLIGLPFRIVPFPLMELQASWVAKALTFGPSLPNPCLPSREAMAAAAREAEALLRPHGGGVSPRHSHAMSADEQFKYMDRLADAAGRPRLPPWRKRAFLACRDARAARPGDYRDAPLDWGGCDG